MQCKRNALRMSSLTKGLCGFLGKVVAFLASAIMKSMKQKCCKTQHTSPFHAREKQEFKNQVKPKLVEVELEDGLASDDNHRDNGMTIPNQVTTKV